MERSAGSHTEQIWKLSKFSKSFNKSSNQWGKPVFGTGSRPVTFWHATCSFVAVNHDGHFMWSKMAWSVGCILSLGRINVIPESSDTFHKFNQLKRIVIWRRNQFCDNKGVYWKPQGAQTLYANTISQVMPALPSASTFFIRRLSFLRLVLSSKRYIEVLGQYGCKECREESRTVVAM